MPPIDYFNPKHSHDLLRTVEQISPEEQASLRAHLAPAIASYRRHLNLMLLVVGIGLVLCVITAALGCPPCAIVFLTCIPLFAIALHIPRLRCPNCNNRLNNKLGPYCPECGRRALVPRDLFFSPKCNACRRTFGSRDTCRHRACSHCGLWLDDYGVHEWQ